MKYEEIRYTHPDGLVRKKSYRKVTVNQAVIVFLIQILLFLSVESLAQIYLGNVGLAITEAIVFAVAFIPTLILHADPREVFPVQKPKGWAVGGSLVFLIGAYSFSVIANCLMMLLFPDQFAQMYESTESVSSSFLTDLIVVCIMPAVCEEALHRGLIQSAVKERVPNLLMQSAIMGLFFAFFHVYPVRYPPMFVMGAALSYVFGITGNMFYSSLMHFSCNLFATVLGYLQDMILTAAPLAGGIRLAASSQESVVMMSVEAFGILLMVYGIPAVFFLYLGEYMIRRGTDPVRPYFVPKDRSEAKQVLWDRIYYPIIALVILGLFFLLIGAAFHI